MRTLLLATLILFPAATLAGQETASPKPAPSYERKGPPELVGQAKVAEDSAVAIALGQVPGGQVKVVELKLEEGKLIYSFEITVPGKPGLTEVDLDALTGRVMRVEHEP